jgi:hypothetical protein
MPALKNQRHEKFALALFEGKSASEAYVLAGYRECRQNASRLMAKDDIQRRLTELQGGAEATAKVTIESIYRELDEAAAIARSKGQGQAMVSVATMRAKLAGLLTERVEVGAPGDFDGLNSTAAIVDRVLERLIEQFKPVDEADRQGLIVLYERHLRETEEYITAINARPIAAERVDVRNLSKPWQSHEPYAARSPAKLTHRTNGTKQV